MILRKMWVLFLVLFLGVIVPLSASEIHSAAKKGDIEAVKQLLEKDPNLLDAGNKLEQTPLLMASYGGHRELVEYLLEKGAKIDQPDAFGATPLHMAVLGGKPEIVNLLIERGADVNIKSKNGKIPLQMAFENDDKDCVAVFIKHGAAIDAAINPYGRTLLHEAVIMGKPKVTNYLIDQGAPLEARDKIGKTALELAYICDNKPLAQLLLDKGAKPAVISPLDVTFIANAGFLIAGKEHKIMVDTLFQTGFEKYTAPSSAAIDNMVKANPPFDKINLLVVTFKQAAHFDPLLTESFLVNNPGAILLSSQQVSLDMELYGSKFNEIKDRIMGIVVAPPMKSVAAMTVQGLKMKIMRLNFAPEFQALGYIINLEGKTLCFLGDAVLKNNEDYIKQLHLKNERIDVLFLTYWDFLNEESRKIIDSEIQPKHIAVMHIPFNEIEKVTADIEKLKKDYPNVTVFKDFMQKQVF